MNNYQVLARKWRPRTFATLVGQEHVVRALSNALAQQRLHHAYLFTGTRGVGKTTLARILAKALNCEIGPTATPCGVCAACTQIDAGRFVDLLEIDAASNTGIDNIREVLDNAQYAPSTGRYKVFIIDEVHMLSKSAFNAMLKTLEEPPPHVKFILATTDPQKVPITVLSRCLQFNLRQMTPQLISDYLATVLDAEQIPYESSALPLIGQAAQGSMRDALSLLDQAIAYGCGAVELDMVHGMLGSLDQRYLSDLLQALAGGHGAALLQIADNMALRSLSFETALHDLAGLLHQIAVLQCVPDAARLAPVTIDSFDAALLQDLAIQWSAEEVQLYYQIVTYGTRDIGLAPDSATGFRMTLLRLLAFRPQTSVLTAPAVVTPLPNPAPPVRSVMPANLLESALAAAPISSPAPVSTATMGGRATAMLAQAKIRTLDTLSAQPIVVPSEKMPSPAPAVMNAVPLPRCGNQADWVSLLETLPLTGLLLQFAGQSTLLDWQAHKLTLRVPLSSKHLEAQVDKLSSLLREHGYGVQEIQLSFEDVQQDVTLAALRQTQQLDWQAQARQILEQDAFVAVLQQQAAAEILQIKPLKNS